MRLLFPVVLVVGVVVMLTSAVASLALSLLLPVVLVLAGVAMIASLRAIGAGIQVTRLGFVSLGAALGYVIDVFTLLFVWPDLEQDLRDSAFPALVARLHPAQFPSIQLARATGRLRVSAQPINASTEQPATQAMSVGFCSPRNNIHPAETM